MLWIGLPDHFLERLLNIVIRQYPVLCQLYNFLNTSAVCVANWLIIVFTVFRLISVYIPHKANIHCSKKRAYFAIFCTVFTPCLYFSYWLYTVEYKEIEDEIYSFYGDCVVRKDHVVFFKKIQIWFVLLFLSVLPFLILIICNCLIIYKLRQARALRLSMNSAATSEESNSMTAMLLSISVLFLVTQTPHFITTIIDTYMNYYYVTEYIASYYLIETATKLLTYVSNVANFFCYCISGKQFRNELALILNIKCWKKEGLPKEDRSMDTVSTVVEGHTRGILK